MRKISRTEKRRRQRHKRNGGFYFQFNWDKAGQRRNGVKRTPRFQITKRKMQMGFPPQKMQRKLKNISTGKWETVEMDQCCASLIGSDPPKRCTKAAIKGTNFCRSHGGSLIRDTKEQSNLRYSEEELEEQIRELTKGDLLDIKEEIAITIIVLRKHIERMLKQCTDKGFNYKDVDTFTKLIDTATKQVLRMDKMKYGKNVITKEELEEALVKRGQKEIEIIDHVIEDEELKNKLLVEFTKISGTLIL